MSFRINPFISTAKLTDRKEDHLTEFFASLLDVDAGFRAAYAKLVLQPYALRRGWPAPEIVSVETQSVFDEVRSRPDMVLHLADGRAIAVEHKLDAPQTMLTLGEDPDLIPQLERYLRSGVDGLAYVRASLNPPAAGVLGHEKYISPSDRQHFLWRDFYPLLEAADSPLACWLREGFIRLGFTPPHPTIGDLVETADKENFAKLWSATKSEAIRRGWSISTGSICELYLTPSKQVTGISMVWLSPASQLLRVRITHEGLEPLVRRIDGFGTLHSDWTIESFKRRQGSNSVEVIELSTPLRTLLSTAQTAEEIEKRLSQCVIEILERLEIATKTAAR